MENASSLKNQTNLKPAAADISQNDQAGILKYLIESASRLNELKSGIDINHEKWLSSPESPELVAEHIHQTIAIGLEIKQLKKELSLKYLRARELRMKNKMFINTLEKRAIGIHAHQQDRLAEYGIKYKPNSNNK